MASTGQLGTGTASGDQTTTGDPQQSTQPASLAGQQSSSGVQPGTASSLLSNQGGIPLTSTPLSTVNLATTTAATTAPVAQPTHHSQPALFIIPVLLFVFAVFLFKAGADADKKTTK